MPVTAGGDANGRGNQGLLVAEWNVVLMLRALTISEYIASQDAVSGTV